MIKCRIANNGKWQLNVFIIVFLLLILPFTDFSHATNCDQYLIQPTPTGNAYITLFISESDFYLYHPGQRSQNGSIIFDFYASDAATVNSTAIYTNIYDISKDLKFKWNRSHWLTNELLYLDSNPFRDGADITTNISLAAQRLGGEGLHVYTLGVTIARWKYVLYRLTNLFLLIPWMNLLETSGKIIYVSLFNNKEFLIPSCKNYGL